MCSYFIGFRLTSSFRGSVLTMSSAGKKGSDSKIVVLGKAGVGKSVVVIDVLVIDEYDDNDDDGNDLASFQVDFNEAWRGNNSVFQEFRFQRSTLYSTQLRALTLDTSKTMVPDAALVVRFLTRRFIWEYDPTLECTYKHHTTIDEESVNMEILDTAGQEWTIQREGHGRWADGFVLVYAINDRQSFEEISNIKQNLDDIKKTNSMCVLVGNKIDLCHERKVSYTEGQNLATDMACAFYETSASDGGEEICEFFHELHREIKRRKQVEAKPRRRSSAHQVRNVLNKMFKSPGNKQQMSPTSPTGKQQMAVPP